LAKEALESQEGFMERTRFARWSAGSFSSAACSPHLPSRNTSSAKRRRDQV
jgi:hypothetical protein